MKIIIFARDHLFSEKLPAFGKFCREKKAPVLGVCDVKSLDEAKKYGGGSVDAAQHITKFKEKPLPPANRIFAGF